MEVEIVESIFEELKNQLQTDTYQNDSQIFDFDNITGVNAFYKANNDLREAERLINYDEPLIIALKKALSADALKTLEITDQIKSIRALSVVKLIYFSCSKLQYEMYRHIRNPLLKSIGIINRCLPNSVVDTNDIILNIVELASTSKEAFNYIVNTLKYNPIFIEMFPDVLNKLHTEERILLCELIPFDPNEYVAHLQNPKEWILRISDDAFYDICISVTERWLVFCSNIKKEEKHITSLLFNPYSNLILYCMVYKYKNHKEEYLFDTQSVLDTFKLDMETWYYSSTSMQSAYFVDITNFYLLSLVNEELNLVVSDSDKELMTNISEFLFSQIKYLHFWEFSNRLPRNYLRFANASVQLDFDFNDKNA